MTQSHSSFLERIRGLGVGLRPGGARLRRASRDRRRGRGLRCAPRGARLRDRRDGGPGGRLRAAAAAGGDRQGAPMVHRVQVPAERTRAGCGRSRGGWARGTLTPRATMDPVVVSGTTVAATLHNIEEIRRKDIQLGDRVVVEKAGEIIPQVVMVREAARTGEERPIDAPSTARTAGAGSSRRGPSSTAPTPESPAQFRERLKWFVGRGQMDLDSRRQAHRPAGGGRARHPLRRRVHPGSRTPARARADGGDLRREPPRRERAGEVPGAGQGPRGPRDPARRGQRGAHARPCLPRCRRPPGGQRAGDLGTRTSGRSPPTAFASTWTPPHPRGVRSTPRGGGLPGNLEHGATRGPMPGASPFSGLTVVLTSTWSPSVARSWRTP